MARIQEEDASVAAEMIALWRCIEFLEILKIQVATDLIPLEGTAI